MLFQMFMVFQNVWNYYSLSYLINWSSYSN